MGRDVEVMSTWRSVVFQCNVSILLVSLVCSLGTSAAAQELTYDQHENVVYGEADGVGLVMDVFTPKGDRNGLGVVDVISGAWHSDRGKIRDHERAQTFQILCGKGYTVFAVRPGSISKFSAPEMLAHINDGIRWVKGHADEYKIDADRLGLMGASAGGHLACLAAVTASNGNVESNDEKQSVSTRVQAVAVFFPLTDFLDFSGKAIDARADNDMGERIRRLAFPQGLGEATDAEVSEELTQISPARLVTPQAPPFLLIHGDADTAVPLQQSERMLAALKQAGVSAELIVKKGGGHPWPTIHEEVQVLADWFDKQLAAN
jgi:acetyl esterase/lipase